MFIYTVTMIIMVVTGGKGTLTGPIIGGLIFGLMPELLRDYARPEVQWIIYGVAIVLIIFFLPNGIVPAVGKIGQRIAAWSARFVPERLRPRAVMTMVAPNMSVDSTIAPAIAHSGVAGDQGPRRSHRRSCHSRTHESVGTEGQDRQPDRPEWRRQDDGVQYHHRLYEADGRRGVLRGPRPSSI